MTTYFSMEKRENFCLDTDGRSFRSYARAYEDLMLHLNAEKDEIDPWTQKTVPKSIFSYKEIPITFPQFFSYDRSDQLILFEIKLKNP